MKNTQKKEMNRQIGAALFSDTERMEMWFTDHWKKVLAVAIVLLIAVTATFGVWKYRAHRNEIACNALRNAATIEALEKNLALYGASDVAPAARFRLANLYLSIGDYPKAIAQFERVAKDPERAPSLAENARLTGISCVELSGDLKKAAADYVALGNDAKISPARRAAADYAGARLLLDLGDLKAAGRVLAKPRLAGSGMMLAYWNGQLDALALSVKNGDYQAKK